MTPLFYVVAGAVALGAGGVAYVRRRAREPAAVLLPGKVLPPSRAKPPPPSRAPRPDADGEDFGAQVCSFGVASHCYWQPKLVKPLGLNRFEWGFCLQQWKDDLARNEKGGIAFADKVIEAILAIASALTLGLSREATERLCFRFRWELRSYSIDGATYWAIRYAEPQKHILTGEIVEPPKVPIKDGAWVHEAKPGDYASGGQWSVPVYSVFFTDGTYRDVVKQSDLRTLLREYELNPETLTDYARAASDEKSRVVLSTKAKAEAVYK